MNPSLYQINTRVVLGELAPGGTLDAFPDAYLDRIADLGFDLVYLLGVWQTGPAGRQVSLSQPDWRRGFERDLPGFTDADVTGSPFAVRSYTVHQDFGGDAALPRLRSRLRQRGLRLMLDFVPNHVALDHPWVASHPEYFVSGTDEDLAREPQNYCRRNARVFAYGRDPYFPGWPDALQLNYCHSGLRAAMLGELDRIADRCDGVRCDMAMLLLPEVCARTWGDKVQPRDGTAAVHASIWPEATERIRRNHAGFLFLAEVYWDLEWELQREGFDYTYDKRLYDRLRAGAAGPVRDHLRADGDFQRRLARFLENHDEPRAAAVFPEAMHQAAAVVTFLTPGLRFFHEGQLEGRRVHVSMHLGRRPVEAVDAGLRDFYGLLLACLKRPEVRQGTWRLCECRAAWENNPTCDNFLAFTWEGEGGRLLATVNYGPTLGQCYVRLPFANLSGRGWRLRDLLSPAVYDREGTDLANRGLYLDVPAWGRHVFEMKAR
jgi:glycosidase